ncbi:MAG: hypothetical protein KDA57_04740 [Planctomycetales bacterium]|nr:hypothetical protein [Planctomycetales bacterium]
MRLFLITLCAALGCQPVQTAPTMLFTAPQAVPIGPAVASPPLQNNTILQPAIAAPAGSPCANPLFVPVTNQDWAWEQIVDVVDDYFRIERENRVQLIGNVMTEGRIDTFPQIGATWLEPHRPDSVGRENRWESTLQTIRRRAVLRVIPEQNGYLVDAVVYKELEDLPRPENSTAGAATFRHDNSLSSRVNEGVFRTRLSDHWLSLGRDPAVEQQMLAEIRARVVGEATGVLLK